MPRKRIPSAHPFDPHRFLAGDVLTDVVNRAPEEWMPRLKELSACLGREEKIAVRREALAVLKRRKEIVEGIGKAVEEVKGMEARDGKAIGERLKGVLLFGSFIGSAIIWPPLKVLSEGMMDDLDFVPVVAGGDPKILLEDMVGRVNLFMLCHDIGRKLDAAVGDNTGIPGHHTGRFLVFEDDPQATREWEFGGVSNRRVLEFTHSNAVYFIGDEKTRGLLAEAFLQEQ